MEGSGKEVKRKEMLSLGQVIQLHISPLELLTGEASDKIHPFYELDLHNTTPPSFADVFYHSAP